MIERLTKMRKLLEDLRTMVEADMPEAQRKMLKGDDLPFDRVVTMLMKVGEMEQEVADALVVETGNPDFGTGQTIGDWAGPRGEP